MVLLMLEKTFLTCFPRVVRMSSTPTAISKRINADPPLTPGADGAADVGEDVLDLLPQRGEDEQHHNGDQHEDQGVLDHALSLLTTGEPAVQRTARHLSKAEVRRGDPGQEFSGPIPRIHAQSVTSKSARN